MATLLVIAALGGEDIPTYEEYKEKMEVLAFLSSVGDDEAAERAQQTFDEMFMNYITEDELSLRPDTLIYNMLIEAYANKDPQLNTKGAQRAEDILDRMEGDKSEFESDIPPPNVDTYIAVMGGHAKHKQPMAAENIFRRLEARYASTGQDTVMPNTEAYNQLVKACMKSGLKAAPKRTENLLHEMLDAKDKSVAPDAQTFAYVKNSHAQTNEKDAVQKVKDLLGEMESLYNCGRVDLKPGTLHYNAYIKAYKGVKGGASQAEALLSEMIERYRQGDDGIRPDRASFINTINALATSRQKGIPQRAEQLLEVMENMSQDPEDDLRPNVRVVNALINIWARSRESGKADAARRLLDKMLDLCASDDAMAPNTRSFNNVLNACAFTEGEKEEKLNAFQVAMRTLNDLRDDEHCEPDHVSFGMFLEACSNLVPPSKKRDAVVEQIFRACCRDGRMSQFVLDAVTEAASEELLSKLFGTSEFDDDGNDISV